MHFERRNTAAAREWERVRRQEAAFRKRRQNRNQPLLNRKLEGKAPEKLENALHAAFAKAFVLLFEKGTGLLEKTYCKEKISRRFAGNMQALRQKNGKRTLRAFQKDAAALGRRSVLFAGAEGVGLGILGIGLPDIPLFTAVILRSLYQTAMYYGFRYDTEDEKLCILHMICGALSSGAEGERIDRALDAFFRDGTWETSLAAQQENTAALLAREMLYMKFVQGLPLVGAAGGVYDTIYLNRILQYAKIQYHKRFLLQRENRDGP